MGVSNTVQQLSVFLENREGRLEEVLDVLAKSNVNIVALSLADTSDYGMLRMTHGIKGSWDYFDADRCSSTSCTTCNRFIEQSNASDRGR